MKFMRNKVWRIAALAFLAGLWGQPVFAEPNGPYTMGFNLGFPIAAGDTTEVLDDGFGFGFDMGFRPEDSPLGLRMDVVYAGFGLDSAVLNQINFANSGYATVWGFDLSAELTVPSADKVRPYVQFGPGLYYQHAEASRYSGGGGYVCDPWFGCYYTGTYTDVASFSTWRLGWMGGAGLSMDFGSGGGLYLQAQYHMINNTNQNTEFVPLSFGYRHSF